MESRYRYGVQECSENLHVRNVAVLKVVTSVEQIHEMGTCPPEVVEVGQLPCERLQVSVEQRQNQLA